MSIRFNADEIFEMAVRAEENGAKFYRRAVELRKGKAEAEFLTALAEMEDQHKATFEAMRANLPGQDKASTSFDPNMEASMYLEAMVDAASLEGAPTSADKLTGEETMADILRVAIGLEKSAILFYLGLKDMVPESLGKDKVDVIIDEEKGHVVQLTAALKKAR